MAEDWSSRGQTSPIIAPCRFIWQYAICLVPDFPPVRPPPARPSVRPSVRPPVRPVGLPWGPWGSRGAPVGAVGATVRVFKHRFNIKTIKIQS